MKSSTVVLAFEVHVLSSRSASQGFTRLQVIDGLAFSISRLLGRVVGEPGVTKDIWTCNDTDQLSRCVLIRLKGAMPVLVVTLDVSGKLESTAFKGTEWLRKVMRESASRHGLEISHESFVYPIMALISEETLSAERCQREWLIFEGNPRNFAFLTELAGQILQRVAIERSLTSWATQPTIRIKKLVRVFRAPLVAYRVRRWNVEPLFDRIDLKDKYSHLREAYNLPGARREVLEKAKSWWSVATVLAALAALFVGPIIESLFKQ